MVPSSALTGFDNRKVRHVARILVPFEKLKKNILSVYKVLSRLIPVYFIVKHGEPFKVRYQHTFKS